MLGFFTDNITKNDINIIISQLASMNRRFEKQYNMLTNILEGIDFMVDVLDTLTEEVTAVETVTGSVKLLLTKLSAEIATIKTQPAKLQALSDRLKASASDLSQAVTDNTEVEDEEVPPEANTVPTPQFA